MTKKKATNSTRSQRSDRQSLLDLLDKAKTREDLLHIAKLMGIDVSPPKRKYSPDAYERKKQKAIKAERAKSRAAREISHDCPPCASERIRERIKTDLKFALLTLWPKRFMLQFSQDQIDFVKDVQRVIREGGQLVRAMPRGTGKTSILLCAVIWAILTGLHPFVSLIGATGTAAQELLEQIAVEFETNDLLYAYFPELVHPIRKLEGINQRRLLWRGLPIKQVWKKSRIVLPNNPAVPGAGSVITVAGLDGRIRGMNYQRTDGVNVRPKLVLIDDPQTRKSSASRVMTAKREQIICGDVLGLAGPGQKIAAMVACTVIASGDLPDRLLDPMIHPEWEGKRTQLLNALPKNLNLWDEYAAILRADLAIHRGRERATSFYRKHRQQMDEGAKPAWKQRFEPGQISAVQYGMDLRILNRESFEAEYQNTPIRQEDATAKIATVREILQRKNKLPRGIIPAKAQCLTAAIDVQGDLLYWMVCWWSRNFTGGITDYGETPDQRRHHFALKEANPTLIQHFKRNAKMPAIRAGLDWLINWLMTREFRCDDGNRFMKVERLCVDANWGESTETVYAACRESQFSQLIRPTHGKGFKVTERPMNLWKEADGEKNGGRWFRRVGKRGVRYLTIDTNWMKTFAHNGLLLMPEEDHSISLFDAADHEHQMLAEHLAESETRHRPRAEDGRTVDIWTPNPGHENHRFDTLVGCITGASELGVSIAPVPEQRATRTGPIEPTYY